MKQGYQPEDQQRELSQLETFSELPRSTHTSKLRITGEATPDSQHLGVIHTEPDSCVKRSSHKRTGTTLIKDIHQSYHFISALEDQFGNINPDCSSMNERPESPAGLIDQPVEQDSRVVSGVKQPVSRGSTRERSTCEFFSTSMYCPECQQEVHTIVRYRVPKVSFWERLLCIDCFDVGIQTKLIHNCSQCYTELDQFNFVLDPTETIL